MTDADHRRFLELLEQFSNAMLVTVRGDELRSRPMAVADVTDEGRVRFLTRDDSAKLEELDENSEVNVAMQGEGSFLSISGRARLSKDPKLMRSTMKHGKPPWFSSGADDPHLMVLEVVPTHAEYWDEASGGVVETVIERARSMLPGVEGGDGEDGEKAHGEVEFHGPRG